MANSCAGDNCSCDLGQAKSKSIGCDFCKKWYCMECSKIPKKIFDALHAANKNREDVSMIVYLCKSCKISAVVLNDIKSEIHDLKSEMTAFTKDLNDRSSEIKVHIDNKMTENSNEFKEEYKVQKKSFAEMVKHCKSIPSIDSINTGFKKAIDTSSLENKEQEVRDRSVMFYYTEESKADTGKDRNLDDIAFINNFIKDGLHIPSATIESCDRIGNFDVNAKRPIKVRFTTCVDQVRVLKNLCNLKNAEEKFKKCFVTIDRNFKQREEIRKLVNEAKEKSEASSDKHYLVRGGPFKPFIVEVEKRE